MLKLTCHFLAVLLHRFFLEWLGEQRSTCQKTITAHIVTHERILSAVHGKAAGQAVAKLQLEGLTEEARFSLFCSTSNVIGMQRYDEEELPAGSPAKLLFFRRRT